MNYCDDIHELDENMIKICHEVIFSTISCIILAGSSWRVSYDCTSELNQ